jgi:hypothetical protein
VLTPGATSENLAPQLVVDAAQFEGQSVVELLGQVLLELRILNQQIFALPSLQNAGVSASDEPASFRNDPTIFQQ